MKKINNYHVHTIFLILFASYVIFSFTDYETVSNILSTLCTLTAAITLFLVYRKSDPTNDSRYIWFSLSLGAFTWASADLLWTIFAYNGIDPDNVDVITMLYYFTNIFFALNMTITIIIKTNKWNAMQLIFDTIIISFSTIYFIWLVFFQSNPFMFELVLNEGVDVILSVMIDIGMIIGILLYFLTSHDKQVLPVYVKLLNAGLMMFCIVDLVYYYAYINNLYYPNQVIDILYLCSIMFLGTAGSLRLFDNKRTKQISKKLHQFNPQMRGLILLLYPILTILIHGFDLIEILMFILAFALYKILHLQIEKTAISHDLLQKEIELNKDLEVRVQNQMSELVTLTNKDILTPLYNRRFLHQQLENQIKIRERSNTVSVLTIDVDRFRTINDIYGHNFGDMVLLELANRLLAWNRDRFQIARLGGDEFIILIAGRYNKNEIEHIASQLIALCNQPIVISERTIQITVSIGSSACPHDTNEMGELIQFADIAMYQAKVQGYNRHVAFDHFLIKDVHKRNEIELLLKKADFKHDFELYYQPQFNIKDKRLIGAEALIRWEHSDYGFISPAEFIPIAEELDLIVELGQWIMEEAFSQLHTWNQTYPDPICMSVNISPKQMKDEHFIDTLRDSIYKTKVSPNRIDLEITENIMLHDTELIEKIFLFLQQLGISVSIDDFGTGYASFNYLNRFRFSRIKLDKSLIDHITTDNNNRQIVNAIIMMTKSMQIATIAEGVETDSQLFILDELECEQVQGYLLGRPVPASVFEDMFLKANSDTEESSSSVS